MLVDKDIAILLSSLGKKFYIYKGPTIDYMYALYYNFKKPKSRVFIHRMVVDAPQGFVVDHINHNTLDNRRCNLRIVTVAENAQNQRLPKNNASGTMCVFYDKDSKMWRAIINRNGKVIYRKRFKCLEDATEAVRQKRAELLPFSQEALMK